MAVIAFMSAKGSPGVTTSALLCAALWPRPVLLVDADADGGDVALRLPLEDGRPVDRQRGVLSLLSLARRELSPQALVDHAQVLRGGTEIVAGLAGPGQVGAAQALWDNLGRAFAGSTEHDILLDLGRISSMSPHLALLRHADLLVCVLRPDVSGVIHTRERLDDLAGALMSAELPGVRARLLLIGSGKGDRDVHGATALLERDLPGVESLGVLAFDPEGASVLAGAELSRPERTLLVRSAHPVVSGLAALVGVEPAALPVTDALPVAPGGRRVAARKPRRGLRRAPEQEASA